MNRIIESIAIALAMIMLSPLIVGIALCDWWKLWRHGPTPTPFIKEVGYTSYEAWREAMERGRKIQAQEEHND